jgi:hypothetical protein
LRRRLFIALLAVSLASACTRSQRRHSADFQPVPPRVYVAKVKNILVGLAPTDAEVRAVEAAPDALGALVDRWMRLPQYRQKMMRFFELAFQQTQVNANDFSDQVYGQLGANDATTPLLLQNATESFARTMVELTAQGRPLSDAMTTRQLMMTTALKELYAFLDTWEIDNGGAVYDHFRDTHRHVGIVVEASQGPIPIAQTLDPASPNYMHWYNPDVATEQRLPQCREDPVTLRASAVSLHYLLLGTLDGRRLASRFYCPMVHGTPKAPQLAAADFGDWTMVTLRPPKPGERTTVFYDLPALRATKELVLSVPRVGFFSTPAFFANWQTNISNQMRVTIHQALIVATGSSIDGSDRTRAATTPGLDAAHANEGACLSCHRILDPTRSIFAATWSWNYHNQIDAKWTGEPGLFAFRGVIAPVKNVIEFARVLAEHPLVGSAWAQKLCYYVNSAPCDEEDPEFKRIVRLFRRSNDSWNTLVKALVTSPLTTYADDTDSIAKNGEVVAVSRRDHLCATLNARLGFADVCGLDALGKQASATTIPAIVSGLPSDAYGRGAEAPILPNQPTLFFVAGTENICESIAARVIDAPAGSLPPDVKHWSSSQPNAAIIDFVSQLMALSPADARAAPAKTLLAAHFAAALRQPGMTPTDALRSTFVVACQAPSTISIGL